MTIIERLELRDAQREEDAKTKEWRRDVDARTAEIARQEKEDQRRKADDDWKAKVERNANTRFWTGLIVTVVITVTASLVLNAPLWMERWQKLHPVDALDVAEPPK